MRGGRIEDRRRFKELELPLRRRAPGLRENRAHLCVAERLEIARDVDRLVHELHAIAAGDHDRSREVERVLEAFLGRDGLRLQNDSVRHALHAKNADALTYELGEDELLEAP